MVWMLSCLLKCALFQFIVSVWCKQNITRNWFVVYFKLFQVFCYWREIYFFPFILIYEWSYPCYSFFIFSILYDLVHLLLHTENNHRFLGLWWLFCFFYPFGRIYVLCTTFATYGTCNTIPGHNETQNFWPSLIFQDLVDTYVEANQKVFDFICSFANHNFLNHF